MNQFEKVQKKATQILLNNYEMPYADRLKMCNLSTLQGRWEQLFVKFATDTVKSGRMQNWIKPNTNTNTISLRKQNSFFHPKCRTERYKRSAVNAIIRAVNEQNSFQIVFDE